jgi:putative phosphoesterase
MKLVVISDTHIVNSSQDLPRKILEELRDADMVIHAGDLADLSVWEKLKKACKNIKAVYGNMDSSSLKKKLPEKEIFRAGKFKIGIMHGWGPPDKLVERMGEVFRNTGVNIVIFGHSHAALSLIKNDVLYFNPGSPTDTIYAAYNSFGIIEINDKIEAKIIKL